MWPVGSAEDHGPPTGHSGARPSRSPHTGESSARVGASARNFSISQDAGIHIGDDAIALRYFIDMAEIPTFQELQTREIPADPAEPRVARYLRDTAETLKKGRALEVDGHRLALDVRSAEVMFPPGVGELPTMKMAILFLARLAGPRRGTVEEPREREQDLGAAAG